MRSLLVSMLILSPFMAISQLYVEGRNVNEMEISYISIEKGTIIGFQSGMACYDTEEAIRGHCAPITDENGNVVKFARPVSMIEFVSKRGCMYEGNIDSDLGDGLAMLSVRKTVLREDTIPPNEKD